MLRCSAPDVLDSSLRLSSILCLFLFFRPLHDGFGLVFDKAALLVFFATPAGAGIIWFHHHSARSYSNPLFAVN